MISQRQPQPGQALLLSHAGLRFWATVMVTTDGSVRAWATLRVPQQPEAGDGDFCLPAPIVGGRQVLGTATVHREG